MAYIGNRPEQGNFRKADSITCSATATYNLLVGGVAVNPNQNQCIVSLNGVVQSSGDSFTCASSQITFASALTSSDVIDFILILGDTLDVGVPSDDTVDASKITANIITGQSALGATPADTDELLISDAGVLKRVDYSYLKSVAGTNSFSVTGSGTQSSIADATWTKITFDSENWDTDDLFASDKFTATDAGKYFFTANVCLSYDSAAGPQFAGRFYKNGSGDSQTKTSLTFTSGTVNTVNARVTGILNLAASDYVELYGYADVGSGTASSPAARSMMGYRVA